MNGYDESDGASHTQGVSAFELGFEPSLIRHLQPIRGYSLAVALFHVLESGIADALIRRDTVSIFRLAAELGMDTYRLEGVLRYLQVEGYARVEGEVAAATQKLTEVSICWPWYNMLIGGYGETFADLGCGLRARSGPLSRNLARVSTGSCGISHFDAIPLTKQLLGTLPTAPRKLVDLGCGDALYLTEFCSAFPDLQAVGVEPGRDGYHAACELLEKQDCADRVKLINTNAQDFLNNADESGVDVIVLGFVLHEILAQESEVGVRLFLEKITQKYPMAHIIVIEVENAIDDLEIMRHPLAKAYYNPYFLVHYFTDQRLEKRQFWEELFIKSGLKVLSAATPNPLVDSTGLEVGFLLERS